MRILISGSTGFVGSALIPFLTGAGHRITRLVRTSPQQLDADAVFWDSSSGILDPQALEGVEAAIHLAGESIFRGRWTSAKKTRLRESRAQSTQLLCRTLASLEHPPAVLLSASAIGYYGDRGEELLDEHSSAGNGFLASLCQEWETATALAAHREIRVVHLRFGLILSPHGGALAMMLLPFRLGLGGRLGSGRQYMSWIALDDVLGAIQYALTTATLDGAVNVVSPQPVTNAEFTRILGRVLSRPTILPAPPAILRLALGEFADAALLASSRVLPTKLLTAGYQFRHPALHEALRDLLQPPASMSAQRP